MVGNRSLASRASGLGTVRIAAVSILIAAAIAVSAILQGEVPEVGHPVFAASVAVSTAIWAGMEVFLSLHRQMVWLWAAVVVAMLTFVLLNRQPARPTALLAAMREL